MKVPSVYRGIRPLLCINEMMLFARGRKIFLGHSDFSNPEYLCTLPSSYFISACSQFRLLRRLLRLEATIAAAIDKDTIIISSGSTIWRLQLSSKMLIKEFVIPEGRKALNIRAVRGIKGISDGLYFGDYFENKPKGTVNIWFRSFVSSEWKIVYQFAANEIEHVHDIVADHYRQCVWILTGDFDHGCGIWQATNNFSTVSAALRASQQYRAAWLAPLSDYLIYATDTPLEQNYLYKLHETDGKWSTSPLAQLPASSIYATARAQTIYFSTTIEPCLLTGNRLHDLFESKVGSGIHDAYARLYRYDAEDGLHEILRAKKDRYPMRLLQYGTFYLSNGTSETSPVYAYGCAVTGLDGCAIRVA